jgi:hypothetical protein
MDEDFCVGNRIFFSCCRLENWTRRNQKSMNNLRFGISSSWGLDWLHKFTRNKYPAYNWIRVWNTEPIVVFYNSPPTVIVNKPSKSELMQRAGWSYNLQKSTAGKELRCWCRSRFCSRRFVLEIWKVSRWLHNSHEINIQLITGSVSEIPNPSWYSTTARPLS